ncbi:hypothetical protein [Vibrio ishigakensis]|nr:hypothetical protein [Vibrio ishigakensis]
MKKKYLALCVSNALIVTSLSLGSMQAQANSDLTFSDKIVKVNGHVGLIAETQDTVYYDPTGSKTGKATYRENSIIDTALTFQEYPLDIFYAFKQFTDEYRSADGLDNQLEEGLKHLILLSTDYYIGNGLNVGASLNNEFASSDRVYSGPWINGRYGKSEHLLEASAFVDYWNSRQGFGAYSYATYKYSNLVNDQQAGADWGDYDINGWAISTRPTMNFDSINIGVEFYYGKDESTGNVTDSHLQDFEEWLVEPSISYTGPYGTLTVRHRYAQQTTTQNGGQDEYFTTVNKTTIGYNYSYNSWRLGGEVEFTHNDNEADTSWSGGKIDNGKNEVTRFMIFGQYAF